MEPDFGTVFNGRVSATSDADLTGISPGLVRPGMRRNSVARIWSKPGGTDWKLREFVGTGSGTWRKWAVPVYGTLVLGDSDLFVIQDSQKVFPKSASYCSFTSSSTTKTTGFILYYHAVSAMSEKLKFFFSYSALISEVRAIPISFQNFWTTLHVRILMNHSCQYTCHLVITYRTDMKNKLVSWLFVSLSPAPSPHVWIEPY